MAGETDKTRSHAKEVIERAAEDQQLGRAEKRGRERGRFKGEPDKSKERLEREDGEDDREEQPR